LRAGLQPNERCCLYIANNCGLKSFDVIGECYCEKNWHGLYGHFFTILNKGELNSPVKTRDNNGMTPESEHTCMKTL
jgi:hypothetical protein